MTDTIAYLVVWTFVALGCLYAIYTISPPKKLIVCLTLIAACIAAPVYLHDPINDAMGYPVVVEDQSTDKFVSYVVDRDQKWLFIWIMNVENDEPRAYKIPYTQEDEEKLAAAAEKGEQGFPQEITLDEGDPRDGTSTSTSITIRDLPPTGGGK